MPIILVTGPVRSGKTSYAQRLARDSGKLVTAVATAMRDPADLEWTDRLARHEADRPANWRLAETAGMHAGAFEALFTQAGADECLMVDSLGTWLAAEMFAVRDAMESDYAGTLEHLERAAARFEVHLVQTRALAIVIGEQVGWDVHPPARSARIFRDVLGRMQQRLAAVAQSAFVVISGFAIDLRVAGKPVKEQA